MSTLNENSTDQEIWNGIVYGDTWAFNLLYDRYWLRLFKTAHYLLDDEQACEELVHDVFITLWRQRASLEIINFSSYINRVTRNEVLHHLRIQRPVVASIEGDGVYEPSVQNLGHSRLEKLDTQKAIDALLKDVPKRCREIFYMSKMQHLSNEEIAISLNINKHTVENQLTYAIKYLRSNLKKQYLLLLLLTFYQ